MIGRPPVILTPARAAGLLVVAGGVALAAQWLRPPSVPADHPDWRVWLQRQAWVSLGPQPWQTVQLHTPRWAVPQAVAPALPEVPPPPAPAAQPRASLAERPLFSPNRRPVPPPPPPPPPRPPDPLEGAVLLGVVGGDRPVILLRLGKGAVQRIAPGGRVGDWRLVTVEPEAATFEHDGQRRRYVIAPGNLVQGAPPSPRPPQQSAVPADDPEAALQRAQQQIEQRRRANATPTSDRP